MQTKPSYWEFKILTFFMFLFLKTLLRLTFHSGHVQTNNELQLKALKRRKITKVKQYLQTEKHNNIS